MSEGQILFWYDIVIHCHHRGTLQIFIMNRNDPRIFPDLCKAVVSQASLLFPLLLLSAALALAKKSAWGYTDVLASTPSLHCINVHVHVNVYTLHCNHCTQLPPAFFSHVLSLLSLTPSYAITGMISTVDPNVSSHD